MTTQIYDQLLSKYPVGHPLCLTASAFNNDALKLLSYSNKLDSNPATNPPPLYIPPPSAPSEKLIAGIICHEQNIGLGQPLAVRLYDPSNNKIIDLTVKDLRNQIIMEIDSDKNLKVSCTEDSSFINHQVWTMIFNIFDASGWALLSNDISFNFTNTNSSNSVNDLTKYDISLANINQILKVQVDASASTDIFDVSNDLISNTMDASYSIYCVSNNELYIKCTEDASWNGYYVNSLNFNLYDTSSNNFLGPSEIYLHLAPSVTRYDISYDQISDASFNINIYPSQLPSSYLENNELNDQLIKLDPSGRKIGTIYPYGYRIQPNLEYYNINNLTHYSQNLITLNPSGVILGQVTFNN